jgi:hypothetical protein
MLPFGISFAAKKTTCVASRRTHEGQHNWNWVSVDVSLNVPTESCNQGDISTLESANGGLPEKPNAGQTLMHAYDGEQHDGSSRTDGKFMISSCCSTPSSQVDLDPC